MVNFFPAVLVGGPPHAGKSVLLYQLTQALRARQIPHHAIRACPDGEGNWFHEGDPQTVSTIRVKLPGEWPATFVQRLCQDLNHRCLPFLVDLGGRPNASQIELLRMCTHSLLLLREDQPESMQFWQRLVEECNLLPLARLLSEQTGESEITVPSPVLEGRLSGLNRHTAQAGAGPLFDELVQRLVTLFGSANPFERKKSYLEQAPTELVLDLDEALSSLARGSKRWEPALLLPFLASLPVDLPLSVYGVGPNWLYAALAATGDEQPLFLFDPKLPFGWIQPIRVSAGNAPSPDISIETQEDQEVTVLKVTFPSDRIDYFQPEPLAFPLLSLHKGLIIWGRVPFWLVTALTRMYKAAGVPWIAPFYAQLNKAVVAYSRVESYRLGDLVPMPSTKE